MEEMGARARMFGLELEMVVVALELAVVSQGFVAVGLERVAAGVRGFVRFGWARTFLALERLAVEGQSRVELGVEVGLDSEVVGWGGPGRHILGIQLGSRRQCMGRHKD